MATITKFNGITVNGEDFSDSSVVRRYADKWCNKADMYQDCDLFFAAYSLISICDDVEGITAELEAWLADPANRDSEEYSDIFKDVYGYRPR